MEISFKRNLGNLDRIVRVILGIAFLWAATQLFIPGTTWSTVLVVLGIFMLLEAALGY